MRGQPSGGHYTYDAFNRNTRVETFDGNIQINHYDAEGLRAEMEENGRLAAFIFNPAKEVVTETEDRTILRYIRGSELIARNTDAVRTYYHYASDEMGSITHVTDEEGNILNRYEYDAWGNLTAEEEQVPNRFKYTGEQFDAITQQYYLRARFYNPALARFMQEDTYRGDGLNLYAYCANNPVRYVDPSGHQCDKKNNNQNQSDEYDINNMGSGMKTNGSGIPLLPGPVITGQNRLPGPVADTPDGGRRGEGESKDKDSIDSSTPKPNSGQGFSAKGYNPKPGERTFEGYVKNNVPVEKETKLFTNSKGFNTNPKNTNGQFKRFGVDGHGPQLPEVHVHQPTRNVSPKTGIIYGGQGTTPLVDVTFPNNKDIKQLYEYLNNGKYH